MPRAAITVAGDELGHSNWPINTLVNLGNAGIGGETTYAWAISDQPPGTPDDLSSSSSASPTFTPRKEGTYLISLVVNVGQPSEVRDTTIVGVRQVKTNTRIPAAGEQSEAGAQRGHAQDANQLLQLLDARAADPFFLVCQAGEALTKNNVVRFTGMATIKSGLPGQELVPIVAIALATSASVQTEQLGVVAGNVDLTSSSISSGALVLVRMGGVHQAAGITGTSGNPIYVSDTGVLSLSAGTNARVIGSLITASDVLLGFGNNAGAGESGSSVSLSSTTPAPVAATGTVGVGVTAARSDHVHAHGDQAGGSLHALVTTSISGFMSATDKVKLDGISPSATSVALGGVMPIQVGILPVVGVATAASREDHVHAHGDQPGGSLHAIVQANGVAGFMSGTDKAKLDGVTTGATNTPLSSSVPSAVANSGSSGSASSASRSDHVHAHGNQLGGTLHAVATTLLNGFMSAADKAKLDELDGAIAGALGLGSTPPPNVASGSVTGVSSSAAHADHTHGHGDHLGGTLHATATTSAAGFMSAGDKAKLDGIASGATSIALASTLPTALGTVAVTGVGTTAARADHVHPHNLSSTNPLPLGATSIGTALTAARADHAHDHGALAGGNLHAVVTTSVAGFMSAADKTKLDGIAPGAGSLALSDSVPASVAATTGAAGASTAASRADHTHAHGNLPGDLRHAVVTTSLNGFMSAADKIKLDSIAASATATPLSNTTPIIDGTGAAGVGTSAARADHVHPHNLTALTPQPVGTTSAVGTGTGAARADHVHAHGNLAGGALHAISTTSVAGFMSAADRIVLNNLDATYARLAAVNVFTQNQIIDGGAFSRILQMVNGSIFTGASDPGIGSIRANQNLMAGGNILGLGDLAVNGSGTFGFHVNATGNVIALGYVRAAESIWTGTTAPTGHQIGDISATNDLRAAGDVYAEDDFRYRTFKTFTASVSASQGKSSRDINGDDAFLYNGLFWQSFDFNAHSVTFAINEYIPIGAVITQVRARVKPASGRTGTSRMYVSINQVDRLGTPTVLMSPVYDSGSSTADQDLVGSTSITRADYHSYIVTVRGGQGGSVGDRIIAVDLTWTTSILRP